MLSTAGHCAQSIIFVPFLILACIFGIASVTSKIEVEP